MLIPADAMVVLHEVADVVGLIISLPIVYGIIQTVRYTGSIEKTIAITSTELTNFIQESRRELARHDKAIEEINSRLWDGKTERRRNIPTERED